MSRKHTQPAPLAAISRSNLEHVVGGRLAVSKGPRCGRRPGHQGLTEGVAALQQKFAADQAGQQQQMGQLMQQMQARRG